MNRLNLPVAAPTVSEAAARAATASRTQSVLLPSPWEHDGDLLDARGRISPQCRGEPAGVLVVVQVAGDAGRADLIQHDVAEEVAGIGEPALTCSDGRFQMNAVSVEQVAPVGLVADPPQHVVDCGLVRADVERLRPLPNGPLVDQLCAPHHQADLEREDGRRVEATRRPVRMRAGVVPTEACDLIVGRGVATAGALDRSAGGRYRVRGVSLGTGGLWSRS